MPRRTLLAAPLLLTASLCRAASVNTRVAPIAQPGLPLLPALSLSLSPAAGPSLLPSVPSSDATPLLTLTPSLSLPSARPVAFAAAPQAAAALPAAAVRPMPAAVSLFAMAADLGALRDANAGEDSRRAAALTRFDSPSSRQDGGIAVPTVQPLWKDPSRAVRLGSSKMLQAVGLRKAAAYVAPPAPAGDPVVDAFVKELLVVLVRSGGDPVKAEAELIDILARAHTAGQLEPVIQALVADPRVQAYLPPMPEAKRKEYAAQLAFMMGAELEGAGKIPGAKPFEPWDDMGRRHMGLVYGSAYAPRGPGAPSLFTEPGFVKEFETLTGASFSGGNRAIPLIDGPASFKVRFALMRKAKKSIHILSWAFYDDVTGEAAADLLIEKKRAGVDVKVMVDGKTSRAHGAKVLERMRAAGIELVLFHDPVRKYDGLHTKVMVVDGRFAVAGGMNFGDEYSHMGQGPKWRDTDMLYLGSALDDSARFVRELWNAQVRLQKLPYGLLGDIAADPAKGTARLSFVAQDPAGEATILLAYLKAIAGASRVIRIENAYFITMPALRQALLDALQRGVRVEILTNSAESVDEPIVSAPILQSLPELIRAGAKAYLKKGDTLHSKFMTVDGVFAVLGSFNLHPRSVRYEKEMVLNVLDERFVADLDRTFRADLDRAAAVDDPDALKVPDSALTRLVRRYLFNQL